MAELKLYDTLTRQEVAFTPRDPGKVSIYACGLTPQAPAHVGHMRGVVVMDVIGRWFRHVGYEVQFVQNFTDIDDKIIRRSQEEGISTEEVAQKYSAMYLEDAASLQAELPLFVKVTENMPDIVAMIERLIQKGHAYEVEGDVYFAVETFAGYGKLSGRSTDELKAGARIEVDERKRNPEDFALWKSAKPGEPAWDSPWGAGRPGWHIECSALSLKYLQPEFDIHAGGMDLIFPHHENEIAQSEAFLDQQAFCRYWLHWGPVRLDKEKMSKSVGNVISIRELNKSYEPSVIRMFLLSVAYRTPLEFSFERLGEAKTALERIRNAVQRAEAMLREHDAAPDEAFAQSYRERFTEAMNNDFNTAQALSVIFEMVGVLNQQINEASAQGSVAHPEQTRALLNAMEWMTQAILGLQMSANAELSDTMVSALMERIIAWRQELRARKAFDMADKIRDELKAMDILIEDSAQGSTWRKI